MGHYIEEAKNMNSIDALSAPSFLIESAKTELQLFEGLIELDFAEVYNENGIISLSEADQESASEQSDQAQNNFIKNIWKKFTDTIKKMLKSIKEKFNEFTKKLADKKVDRDKYIKDEKARSCSIIDIWFYDYIDMCNYFISKTNIEGAIKTFCLHADGTSDFNITLADFDLDAMLKHFNPRLNDPDLNSADTAATWMLDEVKLVVNTILRIPASVDEYNALNDDERIGIIPPVKLGDKFDEFPSLVRELSLEGLTKRIDKCFSMFSKDESRRFKIQKDDSKEMKNAKRQASLALTAIRLSYFGGEIAVCLKAAKIARRNYQIIKGWVKGTIKATASAQSAAEESAILAGIASDYVCESIFEF